VQGNWFRRWRGLVFVPISAARASQPLRLFRGRPGGGNSGFGGAAVAVFFSGALAPGFLIGGADSASSSSSRSDSSPAPVEIGIRNGQNNIYLILIAAQVVQIVVPARASSESSSSSKAGSLILGSAPRLHGAS